MSLHDDLLRSARREMLGQISTTDRLIRNLYTRAARDLANELRSAKKDSLTERWLKAYLQAVEEEIGRMNGEIERAIRSGAQAATQARVNAETEYLARVAGAAQVDESFTQVLANVPTETLRAMYEGKLYTDGRMLSRRIWSATGRLEGNIAEIIQQGVAQKQSPLELARQLEAYVNPKTACPVSWHKIYPSIPFERKIDYNALRLARTSIIHAAWAADRAAAKKNPLCMGLKWNLSDAHYERQIAVAGEDVCDTYARHDEGLGRGVYPVEKIPFPHPQCLCYRTEVLPSMEESADALRKWARGEHTDSALDAGFEKWKRENRAELERLELPNGFGGVSAQEALDKSDTGGTMGVDSISIPHSLGAKVLNYDIKLPDGTYAQLTEGTRITHIKTIAGKGRDRQIDMIQTLLERYPGTTESEWTKCKGIGYVDYFNESYKAELHWYEEPSIGRVEFKIKTKNGAWFIEDEY